RFRKDLYYRLNVMPIKLLPLRERKNTVLPLAKEFLEEFRKQFSRKANGISGSAETVLKNYGWPGNIRELRNVIERAVLLSTSDKVGTEHLPESIKAPTRSFYPAVPFEGTLASVEKKYIEKVLEDCNFNQTRAAGILGIHRSTLIKKIKEFKLKGKQ
ncbi:MAG TPA: helix-turn-helix domain-containing protein, partial [Nitrospiria bacterium]